MNVITKLLKTEVKTSYTTVYTIDVFALCKYDARHDRIHTRLIYKYHDYVDTSFIGFPPTRRKGWKECTPWKIGDYYGLLVK